MDKTITSKDIEALREYLDKVEALNRETPPAILTHEEWDEAMQIIEATGKIPAKYKGRIAKADKGYYDVAEAAHEAKYSALHKEYHDSIIKAILTSPAKEGKQVGVIDLIARLLEDPAIKRELEKELKAGQFSELAPLGSIPNGEIINWLFQVINSGKGGRIVAQNPKNRHEKVTVKEDKGALIFTRENKENGTITTVKIKNPDLFFGKNRGEKSKNGRNRIFPKMFSFVLEKMTAQGFPLEVGFSLQELVDLGMYSTTSNALRGVREFITQQTNAQISGTVKKGRKTVKAKESIMFYDMELDNGYVKIMVNEKLNVDFFANYFTVFPRFAYALNINAFSLVRYIFFRARQEKKSIKEKGSFNINLDTVRGALGLPSIEDVNNRKYRQFIIEPIETAIEEIEEALKTVPEAKEYGFTITPHGTDTSNINKWLEGYLEIGLNGDFAETFIRIATKAEDDYKEYQKRKQIELARIAARQEAKEEIET